MPRINNDQLCAQLHKSGSRSKVHRFVQARISRHTDKPDMHGVRARGVVAAYHSSHLHSYVMPDTIALAAVTVCHVVDT